MVLFSELSYLVTPYPFVYINFFLYTDVKIRQNNLLREDNPMI